MLAMLRALVAAVAILSSAAGAQVADPGVLPSATLDPARPLIAEERTTVADGFTIALAGDLIVARPLSRSGAVPGFAGTMRLLHDADIAFGNLETSIVDLPAFRGSPYPFDGDWATIALPAVAADLATIGFDLLGRANNHALDWGLAGMRETDARLDAAGLVHAGTGATIGLARAPAYVETAKGRIALVSFATTFRPTSEAMPPHGAAPGRAGLSALHLARLVHVPPAAMRALAAARCALDTTDCGAVPHTLTLDGTRYVADGRAFIEWVPDPTDLAEILLQIREARQHADLVLVAVHAHECDWACDRTDAPQLPGAFLKTLAHQAVDAGADIFAVTGIHNLGPIELYRGRPIFYGLANFVWSDIQEPIPAELFRTYAPTLAATWAHPERATDYDLTAPLNATAFANRFTFQSVLAEVRYADGRATEIELHPIWLGYGETLRTSGTPRPDPDPARARDTIRQIVERTRAYGLPPLDLSMTGNVATIRAAPAPTDPAPPSRNRGARP